MQDIPYREAVGLLMYTSIGTRPDISFAIMCLSYFSTNPGEAHWEAVKCVFRYLKGTLDLWMVYRGVKQELTGWADADGSVTEDWQAISGYAFLINGGAVLWSTKCQEIILPSTTESKYIAATHAAKEAIWLRLLIGQLFPCINQPTTLFSDNKLAIALSENLQYHAHTKHIDIQYHFIHWIIDNGTLRLVFCLTNDMIADTLTKALLSPKVKQFTSELSLGRV
jgi:hypothetical protein